MELAVQDPFSLIIITENGDFMLVTRSGDRVFLFRRVFEKERGTLAHQRVPAEKAQLLRAEPQARG